MFYDKGSVYQVSTSLLFFASVGLNSASAQTYDESVRIELSRICGNSLATGNLIDVCSAADANGVVAPSGVGSQSQPVSILISQKQLKEAQTEAEKNLRPGPQSGGGAGDKVAADWGDFSTFLTAGATTLRHYDNPFEQGYNASIPSVTAGLGYSVMKNLEVGLAFNYSNSNGRYFAGGGFNNDSYSPLLFVNYFPNDNAFINLALSYTRQNQTTERNSIAVTSSLIGPASGLTRGTFNANQYTFNLLSGYDFHVDSVTFGPRFGVDARQWDMSGYQETTNTGLELRFDNQHQTSVQHNLGFFASSAYSFDTGVLVPQASVSWVHEYANDSRVVTAHFVQALDSTTGPGFSFQTENPARDWALIDVGVSWLMKNNLQAFANFTTVQGNQNFESYGGNLGFRIGW